MTFTKEQLQHIIETDHVQCGDASALARMALAGMEAEPVGEFYHEARWGWYEISEGDSVPERARIPLYRVPPAPVSVPAAMEMDDDFDSAFEHGKAVGWNAYRAAMLQAEPVSNSDELPLDYLQGHKDGLEWAAQLAEANHPQTSDWLYDDPIELARAIRKGPDMPTVQGGNSPVIPDGWVACVERMPSAGEQVLAYRPDAPESNDPLIKMATYVGGSAHGHGFDCYCKPTHWMPLPAAPQQEVK
ncbi:MULTISPECIES: DUF551 domain-containing protein [unclassified Enterobacter]|uniref:DUF551 domain-containing protein n=1 Tax=unclassified Enterobacter TaxID=2608935 RepID=UPI002017EC9A|nr:MULTISPECIES: DUF551 domain-containing protein [unclassified Enterobacter]